MKRPARILWASFMVILFISAVIMEMNNFMNDPRGISVKLFEAILELGGILFGISFVAYLFEIYPITQKQEAEGKL